MNSVVLGVKSREKHEFLCPVLCIPPPLRKILSFQNVEIDSLWFGGTSLEALGTSRNGWSVTLCGEDLRCGG